MATEFYEQNIGIGPRSFEELRDSIWNPHWVDEHNVRLALFRTLPRNHVLTYHPGNPGQGPAIRISIDGDPNFLIYARPDFVSVSGLGYLTPNQIGHRASLVSMYTPTNIHRYKSGQYRLLDARADRWARCPMIASDIRFDWDGHMLNIENAPNFGDDILELTPETKKLVTEYLNWWEYAYRNHGLSIGSGFHQDHVDHTFDTWPATEPTADPWEQRARHIQHMLIKKWYTPMLLSAHQRANQENLFHARADGRYKGNMHRTDLSELNIGRKILRNAIELSIKRSIHEWGRRKSTMSEASCPDELPPMRIGAYPYWEQGRDS